MRHGKGVVITPSGARHEGTWIKDEYQQPPLPAKPPTPAPPAPAPAPSMVLLTLYDLQAYGVPNMDAKGGISRHGADPYVCVTLLGTSMYSSLSVQSGFIRNQVNPKWPDQLMLPIPAAAFGGGRVPQLKLTLFDKDWSKHDDFIAEAVVALPADLASNPGK